jgi:protein-S-isoprenylcysteine O-methyltransferase Ste14
VAAATGIQVIRTPVQAPRASAVCERFLGSVRRAAGRPPIDPRVVRLIQERPMSRPTVAIQTLRTAVVGVIALGAPLFVPAGTLDHWQAWLFIVVFTVSTSAIGVDLALRDPALLERRTRIGPAAERNTAQRVIMSLAIASSLGTLVLCGIDHRFGWSSMPPWVSLAGDALVALGLFVDLLVFRANTYGASNAQVEAGQRVISTGPYAIVRHPMYAGVLVMVTGAPLAPGSWWGLLVVAITVPVLVWRILDEEALLRDELPGYADYTRQVRHQLVPLVW